jgi:hypothetical protein
MSPRTLEGWRSLNTGPAYLKIVGRVIYRLIDIEAYEAKHLLNTAMNKGPSALGCVR